MVSPESVNQRTDSTLAKRTNNDLQNTTRLLPLVPIFRHIKSNNSGTAKVKIVKKERDPPLFTSKQLIIFLKDSKKHNSSYRTT